MAEASGPRASFGQRLGAGIIDAIIVGVISLILRLVLGTSGQALGLLVGLAYTTYLEGGTTGQSIGKRVLGIRVVDAQSGGPIGYGRGAIRWLVGIVSAIPIFLGYLWMLWDGEKQTWHDKASTSYVVPVSAYPLNA
jgi:uncharacterized RDD family membrane protein YckC